MRTAEQHFELTSEDWDCLRRAYAAGLRYAVRVVNKGRAATEGALSRDQLAVLARSGVGEVLARAGSRLLLLREGDSRGVEVTALARQLLLTREGFSLLEGIALRLVTGNGEEALRLLREGLSGNADREE